MRYKPDTGNVYEAYAKAEMIRLCAELHGGKYAPSMAEYEAFSAKDAPTKTFVSKRYPGGWAVFAEVCGLQMAEYFYYYHVAKQRQSEWDALEKQGAPSAVVVGKERDDAERDNSMGVTVKPTPRRDVWYSKRDGKIYEGLAWQLI